MLQAVLDQGPVIGWVDVDRADHGMRVAGACIAGGIRVLAVSARVPSAADLVAALSPRGDLVIGLAMPRGAGEVAAAVGAGATFVIAADADPEVAAATRGAGATWIPGAITASEVASCRRAGAELVHLFPAATGGGPTHLALLRRVWPELQVIAGGGIGGDRVGDWLDAGARAVLVAGALYSPALLEANDMMTVRDQAAAVHRDATRRARTSSRGGAA